MQKGDCVYVLNAHNAMGATVKERQDQFLKELMESGFSAKPTTFVPLIVTLVADQCFEFSDASKLIRYGSDHGCIGFHNPFLLSQGEMKWLNSTLKRLGTKEYDELKQISVTDDDASRIVSYCELAEMVVDKARADGENVSIFNPQQFLNAVIAE